MTKRRESKRLRRERALLIAVPVCVLVIVVVLLALHGREVLAFLTDGHRVQQQVERLGPLAPVALGALVVLQEVTVIMPSEPIELAAGYAFGFWRGALIYLGASVVGCLAIIGIVRLAGGRVLRVLLSPKRRAQLQSLRASKRFDIAILIAFFIPGLPKDILAYAASLAGMQPIHLLVVTTLGRLPSILAATLASSFAADGKWWAAALVFAATAALALVGLLVYHHVKDPHDGAPRAGSASSS